MPTDKNPPERSPIEFAEGHEVYLDALVKAWKELDDINQKEKEMAFRKAKLNETVDALRPLVFKQSWDINSLTLSDAIRFVFNNTKRPMSAIDVRAKLEDLGYNLKPFENPLASIHTAIRRMGETNELHLVEKEGKQKSFEAGPELKIVETNPSESLDAASMEALTAMGLDTNEKK